MVKYVAHEYKVLCLTYSMLIVESRDGRSTIMEYRHIDDQYDYNNGKWQLRDWLKTEMNIFKGIMEMQLEMNKLMVD